jgi:hypothetical protein
VYVEEGSETMAEETVFYDLASSSNFKKYVLISALIRCVCATSNSKDVSGQRESKKERDTYTVPIVYVNLK